MTDQEQLTRMLSTNQYGEPISRRPHEWSDTPNGLARLYESLLADPQLYNRPAGEELWGTLQELVHMSEMKGLGRMQAETDNADMMFFRPPTNIPLSKSRSKMQLIPPDTDPSSSEWNSRKAKKFYDEQRKLMTPNNEAI